MNKQVEYNNITMDMNKDRMYFLIAMIVVAGLFLSLSTGMQEWMTEFVLQSITENNPNFGEFLQLFFT